MDADRFDTLSRHIGTVDTRRDLLRLLGALPLVCALAVLQDEAAGAEAPLDKVRRRAGRHHQRQRHQHRHDQRKGERSGDHHNDAHPPDSVGCPAGTVTLANGSCAIPCNESGCPGDCRCTVVSPAPGPNLCTTSEPEVTGICPGHTAADCELGSGCFGSACLRLCPPPCDGDHCSGDGGCQYSGYPCGGLGPQCCPGLVCQGFPFFVCR